MPPFLALALAQPANALDDPPKQPEIRYRDVTTIDVEEDLDVMAGRPTPRVKYVVSQIKLRFGTFVILRKDFDDELRDSVDEIR